MNDRGGTDKSRDDPVEEKCRTVPVVLLFSKRLEEQWHNWYSTALFTAQHFSSTDPNCSLDASELVACSWTAVLLALYALRGQVA